MQGRGGGGRGLAVVAAVAALLLVPAGAAPAASTTVVISELATGGPSGPFVELVNVSAAPVDVSLWRLQPRDAACAALGGPHVLPAGLGLAPGQHLLVAGPGYAGATPADDAMAPAPPAGGGAVTVATAEGAVVDEVGFGDVAPQCGEGTPAADPATGSIERAGGRQDTDANAVDFAVRAVAAPQGTGTSDTLPVVPAGAAVGVPAAGPGLPAILPAPGPTIGTLGFDAPVLRGRVATLVVSARDVVFPLSGYEVDFGERGSRSGGEACFSRSGAAHGARQTFQLDVRFLEAGAHTVTVTMRSGFCAPGLTAVRSTTRSLRVAVREPEPVAARARARAAARGAAAPAPRRGPRACRDATLAPSAAAGARVAAAVRCLVNRERRRHRLRALRPNGALTRSALAHARDMLSRRYFAHEGAGGPSLSARLGRARYRGSVAGENIGWAERASAQAIVHAWMNSPPHRANILRGRFRSAGVAVQVGKPVDPADPGTTFTMNFGSARR